MKTIIVYYSMSGNTDAAAREIAAQLGAALLRLEPDSEPYWKQPREMRWT